MKHTSGSEVVRVARLPGASTTAVHRLDLADRSRLVRAGICGAATSTLNPRLPVRGRCVALRPPARAARPPRHRSRHHRRGRRRRCPGDLYDLCPWASHGRARPVSVGRDSRGEPPGQRRRPRPRLLPVVRGRNDDSASADETTGAMGEGHRPVAPHSRATGQPSFAATPARQCAMFAATGSRASSIGRRVPAMRCDFAMSAPTCAAWPDRAADEFLAAYRSITGETLDPFWIMAGRLEHDHEHWTRRTSHHGRPDLYKRFERRPADPPDGRHTMSPDAGSRAVNESLRPTLRTLVLRPGLRGPGRRSHLERRRALISKPPW